ncbi:hypothetical protein [Streptomyces sp. 35G-GA-8]|nr:hypothetical protein [Streptomyces sp. 35G-GA-8]
MATMKRPDKAEYTTIIRCCAGVWLLMAALVALVAAVVMRLIRA